MDVAYEWALAAVLRLAALSAAVAVFRTHTAGTDLGHRLQMRACVNARHRWPVFLNLRRRRFGVNLGRWHSSRSSVTRHSQASARSRFKQGEFHRGF